ncbi:MAG: pole-organizing protein PopZ [Rhodothalassiaceae bacterium]
MSETVEKEPTMEEILASIRRIISEDAPEEESASPAPDVEDEAVDPPEPEPEPEPEPDLEEDVLELADFAEPEPEPESEPELAADHDSDPRSEDDEDRLVSEPTERRASASFAELSAMLVGGYEGAGNTLEGLVREMLKPMLRAWLDENLPRIVEDMVEREVARIAARKGRG